MWSACWKVVTCKEVAIITVTLSVDTARRILLPENWRLICPRTAGSPLDWTPHKTHFICIVLIRLVCVFVRVNVSTSHPFSFHCGFVWRPLTQCADRLSGNTHCQITNAQTQARTCTHTKNSCEWGDPVAPRARDLHVRFYEEGNEAHVKKLSSINESMVFH